MEGINEDINESEVTYMATVYFYLPTFHFHAIMKLRVNGALIATETIQRAPLSSSSSAV